MVGHERSPKDSPGSAAPRVSIPGQQRTATIINPARAMLFSGFPAADSSSAARLDLRDFVFDLAPEKEGTMLAGRFVLFPMKLGLAPDRVETRRGQNDGEKHDLRFILPLVAPEFMAFLPLCRSTDVERRRLWVAKLFAGCNRVRRRCLLSKIREKYLRHIYISIEISSDIFKMRWHLSDDGEKDLN